MSASNSISHLLEQFLELNTNSLETFKKINEAITTDKETVSIDLFDTKTGKMETIQIPAFGYLKREIDRLNKNVSSISGLEGSNANVRLKDGTFRTIHTSRLKGPSPSITSLTSPTQFSTKLNDFFENFLNPLLTVNLDVSGQIPVETEKVYVERYIFNENDLPSITSFDEIYKGGSEISYTDFKTRLSGNNFVYYLDSQVIDMPIRTIQYTGFFDVVKIDNAQKNIVIDGITQTKTVKLFTLNKLSFTDSTKSLKDTETLKTGDSVIINSGNYRTRYKIISIDSSTSQVELLLLEGSEAIKLGVNQLGIYKDVDTDINIEINVAFNERQVIFVKPIDPVSKIPAEDFSPGVGFYSNDLETVDVAGNKMKLAEYYKNEVADFGQFLKSLKVDYIPPAASGITPTPPVINIENFKVVQINKHLTDNTATDKIKQLKSDKSTTEQSLKQLDESIKQKKSLINSKKFASQAERDTNKNELSSLVSQRDLESKLFSSIVSEIKSSAESADLQTASPKYKARGFWSVPEPKTIGNQVSQEVVQFKIRYRYASTTGKTSEVDQIKFIDATNQTEKTAAFSNWVEVSGPVRKREMDSSGKFGWVLESEEDANAVNFNSFDIAINPGEVIEFMIKSISEAGFPANPLESEWSSIQKIEFPQAEINTDPLGNVIKNNELDILKVQIQQNLESAGVFSHVGESFTVGNQTFAHSANTISSGFITDNQSPITVYEKLLALQNEILGLKGVVEKTTGELLVRIIDENGNVTPVTNNTTVQLFAGYYSQEIPTFNGKGSIVTKNFKIELSNTKATDLELIARIVGDTTQPAPVSSSNVMFGLGTGSDSIDSVYGSNAYYTTEAKYDLVPVVYQNINSIDTDYINNSPEQSSQLKGQFIYSRFRNIANSDNLYVINEGINKDGNIYIGTETTRPVGSAGLNSAYDKYEYGISYNFEGIKTSTDGSKDFSSANLNTTNPVGASYSYSNYNSTSPNDFIWNGTYNPTTKIPQKIYTFAIDYSEYSNGIYLHVDHPLLKLSSSNNQPVSGPSALQIASNGIIGMPKTATLRADDIHGKKQTPLRIINTISTITSAKSVQGIRQAGKSAFSPEDQYLLGGRSCGSFLYLSPLNTTSLSVDASNKSGKKLIPGGSANAISVDLVFQYRMTDYYGPSNTGTGRIGGVLNNTFTNLTYAKKIGIDILQNGIDEFQFDVEVTAKYKTEGRNVNNITSTMLSSYVNNYSSGTGRRGYLSSNSFDLSFPDINQF
jgi:hypothetical protein